MSITEDCNDTENTDKDRCFSPVFITLVYFRYLLTEVY